MTLQTGLPTKNQIRVIPGHALKIIALLYKVLADVDISLNPNPFNFWVAEEYILMVEFHVLP